ncbi:MAG: DUF559 domain-containing protein [Phycisphaerales bacterium]|nr:DUF559 domain-containing protein [Phycisphaerales bacterium]
MASEDPRPKRSDVKRTPSSVDRARSLRAQMARPEAVLWNHLRAKRLAGLRFRRQHPMGPFIADFYCHQASMVVEVDGAAHAGSESRQHDASRDAWMRDRGVEVLRVPAAEVSRDVQKVLGVILAHASARIRME